MKRNNRPHPTRRRLALALLSGSLVACTSTAIDKSESPITTRGALTTSTPTSATTSAPASPAATNAMNRPPTGNQAEVAARLELLGDPYPGHPYAHVFAAIEMGHDWTGQETGVLFRETVEGQPGAWLLCAAGEESLPPGCSLALSLYGDGGVSEEESGRLVLYENEDGSHVVEMSKGVVSRTGTLMHDSVWFVVEE